MKKNLFKVTLAAAAAAIAVMLPGVMSFAEEGAAETKEILRIDGDEFKLENLEVRERTVTLMLGNQVLGTAQTTPWGMLFGLKEPVVEGLDERFEFDDWYIDSNCEEKFIPELHLFNTDSKLYARFYESGKKSKVFFVLGDGRGEYLLRRNGSAVGLVPVPTRSGFDFDGWYKTPECNASEYVDLTETIVTNDSTFYAKWVPATGKTVKQVYQGVLRGSNGAISAVNNKESLAAKAVVYTDGTGKLEFFGRLYFPMTAYGDGAFSKIGQTPISEIICTSSGVYAKYIGAYCDDSTNGYLFGRKLLGIETATKHGIFNYIKFTVKAGNDDSALYCWRDGNHWLDMDGKAGVDTILWE